MSRTDKRRFDVFHPIERPGGIYWQRIGIGLIDQGSMYLYLEALPRHGQLQIRVHRDDTEVSALGTPVERKP
jgi:hypothetical protein